MSVILGYVLIVLGVFGGFALGGGYLGSLLQPVELLMICGAAAGAFVVGNTPKAIKATLQALPSLFKGSRYTRALYVELMLMLYAILARIRSDGLMSIEADIDRPQDSALFARYPLVMADHHMLEFLTDYLRLMVSGNMDPIQLENLMDILREIAPVLNDMPNRISLSGHTDAHLYANGNKNYSNWELSSERANAARRALVAGGLEESRLMRVIGLSSAVLLDPDDALNPINRRISIILLSKRAEEAAANEGRRQFITLPPN